eukprot:TRINITY_DN5456_c0_g1_i1.p1 TRINITY_DN5456_c0_g1~~TRINITY_DN5456_c0_g1_i1.p1  ORF type:complete len:391 (+),score=96.55 TRINITY_DN5456_c0_g1_i1:257-1429(+)
MNEEELLINTDLKPKMSELIKKLSVVSIGLCCDAYFLFQMNIIMVVFKDLYTNENITMYQSFIAGSILFGSIVGQLLFGYLGDKYGRLKMFVWTLIIMVALSLVSAFAFDTETENDSIYIWITIARFFLGIGIGGEYPLSATIIAECSEENTRGRNMSLAFSSQGVGNVVAPLVYLIILKCDIPLDYSWRISLVFPLLPLLVTLPFRLKLAKEEQTAEDYRSKIVTSPQPKFSIAKLKKNVFTLIGTSTTWFIFDISFYGNALFSATVISLLGLENNSSPKEGAISVTLATLIMAAIGLPGYFAAIYFSEKIGRKNLQMVGFAAMCVLFFLMGFLQERLTAYPSIFISIYGLTFFFGNCGPNATTYVLAAESFEKSLSSTCHGLSSAYGS